MIYVWVGETNHGVAVKTGRVKKPRTPVSKVKMEAFADEDLLFGSPATGDEGEGEEEDIMGRVQDAYEDEV